MMEKNGSTYYLSNPEYKKEMIKKYGVDNPSKLKEIKEKRSERLKDTEYQKKMLDGVLEKYGIDNISKLEEIKEKKKSTCLENYGVENPMQNEAIFIKSQKSGKKIKQHTETGLYYRGTYEKDFLDFCYEHDILISKGKTIKYKKNNKNKVYYSDFFIDKYNLIIEIKSSYYYEKYKELNILKKRETIKQGYMYIMIIDKEYEEIKKLLNI
ncbi:MAG: hypothetical protein M0R46_13820 [Candidatus Muirbacterium halophilum]|nr:hypothetical protein [Candidatus Muirbacterium halophilum]